MVRGPTEGLTQRQIDIIRCIANDFGGKEIAIALGISCKTVEYHLANIRRKLGVRGVAGITRYAVGHGLIECADTTERRAVSFSPTKDRGEEDQRRDSEHEEKSESAGPDAPPAATGVSHSDAGRFQQDQEHQRKQSRSS